jgi:hypothetical protein
MVVLVVAIWISVGSHKFYKIRIQNEALRLPSGTWTANRLPNIHLETTQMITMIVIIFKVIFGVSEFGTTLEQQQKSTTIKYLILNVGTMVGCIPDGNDFNSI